MTQAQPHHSTVTTSFDTFCQQHKELLSTLNSLNPTINSNIVLYAIWFAQQGYGRLPLTLLKNLHASTNQWQQLISLPLQTLDSTLPTGNSITIRKIHKSIHALIRSSNRIQQEQLTQLTPTHPQLERSKKQILNDICTNITHYLRQHKATLSQADFSHIFSLLTLLLPEYHPAQIKELLHYQCKINQIIQLELAQLRPIN